MSSTWTPRKGTLTVTDWSFSDLKKQYGEDAALAMLPYMKGYGQFGKQMAEDFNDNKRTVDIPLCPLCDQPLNSARPCG